MPPTQPLKLLKPRLTHLFNWVLQSPAYNEIWDLCCDHGLLGLHLHQAQTQSNVYLVDQISSITNTLSKKYEYLNDGRLFIQQQKAEEITLNSDLRQLIIIAGIGGESLIQILKILTKKITQKTKIQKIDFLLSPNSHNFELRQFLINNNFTMIKEDFVSEKKHHHEHLFLSYSPHAQPNTTICPVGQKIWLPFTKEKQEQLNKRIQHYQEVLRFTNSINAKKALNQYQHLKHTIT